MSDIVDTRTANDTNLLPGTRVEVRRRFDDRWSSGFEVAEVGNEGYLLLRLSDHSVIPTPFDSADLRPERGAPTWTKR
jgi:hypothetical protein